jgi:hypothetical protein
MRRQQTKKVDGDGNGRESGTDDSDIVSQNLLPTA